MKLILFLIFLMPFFSYSQTSEDSIRKEIEHMAMPVFLLAQKRIDKINKDILNANNIQKQKDVIRYYNDTISPVMGKKHSFNAVIQRIKNVGNDYPEYLFQLEIARLAKIQSQLLQYKIDSLKNN
jgi:hypothetical protein